VSAGDPESGSDEAEPSKFTVNAALPVVLSEERDATGQVFGLHTWLLFTVYVSAKLRLSGI
jgi:hypothetical protein